MVITQTKAGPKWLTPLLILLVFTFKFLLFVPQVYYYNASSPTSLPPGLALVKLVLGIYSRALLTPPDGMSSASEAVLARAAGFRMLCCFRAGL